MKTTARLACFLAVGAILYSVAAKAVQAVSWEQTAHWAGTKTMEPDGSFPCVGFSTGLNQVQYPLPNYKAVIKYKGENNISCNAQLMTACVNDAAKQGITPVCCTQTDGDGIWVGGNNAAFAGVNFIQDINELQFGTGIAKATTTDGTWHTYTVTRMGPQVFLDLDGTLFQTLTSTKLNKPDTLALGGKCTADHNFNWNDFSYDITFYYGKECQAGTTTAEVSADGNTGWRTSFPDVTLSSLYVRGNSSTGQLKSLSESPGGWSQSSPTNLTPYLMNLIGFSLGTHTVTATGGDASCPSTGTATFSCTGVAPALTPTSPQDNKTISTAPTSYNWSNTNNFGMDSCGSNFNKTNDSLTVTLYDDSSCSSNPEVQCSLSGPGTSTTTSCANKHTNWVPNQWYCWKLTANNGASDGKGSLNTYAKFYFAPQSGPWWNTDSGGVYSEQSIVSKIPSSFCTDPLICKFSTASSGAPGVVIYAGTSADFNGSQNISQTGWLASAGYQPSRPSFADFRRQVPIAPTSLNESDMPLSGGQIISKCTDASGECYLEYAGTNFRTGSDINVGKRKVVIYVPNGTVKLGSDIKVNRGFGFFGLVTTAPVTVDPAVHSLDAAIFTDDTFTTLSAAPASDSQLIVNGMVVARHGVTLGRDLGPANNTQPAERFIFAPDFLFILPRGLRRFQYQLTEVPPS